METTVSFNRQADTEHLRSLYRKRLERLRILEVKAAQAGAALDDSTLIEIDELKRLVDETRVEIEDKDQELRDNVQSPQPNIDELAASVYSHLRRRLLDERERLSALDKIPVEEFKHALEAASANADASTATWYSPILMLRKPETDPVASAAEPNAQAGDPAVKTDEFTLTITLPNKLATILEDIASKSQTDSTNILIRSITLMAVALKAKEAGLKVGLADNTGTFVMEITGI
jgi:predicted transcriptional regulator